MIGWELCSLKIPAVSKDYDSYPLSCARNEAVDEMLSDKRYTHILFIDDDNIVPQGGITKMLNHDVPIVSAAYLARKGTGLLVVMRWASDPPKTFPPKDFPYTKGLHPAEFERLPSKNGLVKVDAVGCGCLLIKREVFQKLSRPYFKEDWGEESNTTHRYGEDVYFGLQCYVKGIPIYVDKTVLSPHLAWQFLGRQHYDLMVKNPPKTKG